MITLEILHQYFNTITKLYTFSVYLEIVKLLIGKTLNF